MKVKKLRGLKPKRHQVIKPRSIPIGGMKVPMGLHRGKPRRGKGSFGLDEAINRVFGSSGQPSSFSGKSPTAK